MKPELFFGSSEEDDELEQANGIFWRSLLGHVRTDVPRTDVSTILDIGCHHGGLLELFAKHYKPHLLAGIEPLERARQRARFRLSRQASEVELRPPEEWGQFKTGQFDLVLCHEVLHLVPYLAPFMLEIARVLRPAGYAYLVLGCHTENPLWATWREQLASLGHEVFDHAPFDILTAASNAGLDSAMRPLRRDGWVLYDPLVAKYHYPSAAQLFDHQYRHKILFRICPREKT